MGPACVSLVFLAMDFFAVQKDLHSLGPEGSEHLLAFPSRATPEIGGKVAGSTGADLSLCPHSWKFFPWGPLETSEELFSWACFFFGLVLCRAPEAAEAEAGAAAAVAPW